MAAHGRATAARSGVAVKSWETSSGFQWSGNASIDRCWPSGSFTDTAAGSKPWILRAKVEGRRHEPRRRNTRIWTPPFVARMIDGKSVLLNRSTESFDSVAAGCVYLLNDSIPDREPVLARIGAAHHHACFLIEQDPLEASEGADRADDPVAAQIEAEPRLR